MTNFRCLVVFILFLGFTKAQEKNDSTLVKVHENQLIFNQLLDKTTLNPAQQYLRKNFSITELAVGLQQQKKQAFLQQKGKGTEKFKINTNSYYKIDSSNVVWGSASYTSGKRKSVLWNESSDYDIIFPYVSADSIGGDLKYETYQISGGYNRKINTYQLGIEAHYRALNDYRNIDPRPKNVVSDFKIHLGLSKEIANYSIGLDGFYQQYSQSNSIKFYKVLGAPPVYHMTGLGSYNNLFMGNKLDAYFDGKGFGGSLGIMNTKRKGLIMNLGYKNFQYDKIMTSFQDLTASSIKENQYWGKADYRFIGTKYNALLSISGNIQKRVGEEGIFYNQTSSNYIRIGTAKRYEYRENNALLSAALQRDNAKFPWSVAPFAGLLFSEESYQSNVIRQSFTKMNYGIDFQFPMKFKNSLLHFNYKIQMMKTINESSEFDYAYTSSKITEMIRENFNFLRSDYLQMDFNARFDFKLLRNHHGFISSGILYQTHFGKENTGFEISTGFVF